MELEEEIRKLKVYDILLSCDAVQRDARINHTILRNNDILHCIAMNARASYRWVSVPGCELIFGPNDVMRYVVDPATPNVQIHFYTTDKAGKPYAEYFKWTDDKLICSSCVPLEEEHKFSAVWKAT